MAYTKRLLYEGDSSSCSSLFSFFQCTSESDDEAQRINIYAYIVICFRSWYGIT